MDDSLPVIEFAFPGPLRDRLVGAIRSGAKTATSSLLSEYQVANEPLPAVGDTGAVINSQGQRVAVIETTAVRVISLGEVPLDHALAEGEGYASVEDWRAGHARFWTSAAMSAELGGEIELTDATPVVLEQFVLIG